MGQFEIGVRAIILYDKRMLLTRRSGEGQIWECPGGKVEFGEDLQDALRREIREEAGLEIDIQNLLYALTVKRTPALQIIGLMYLCRAKSDKGSLSHEHMDFMWADNGQCS